MNYYIDFDGTLYDTTKFKKDILKTLAKTCYSQNKKLRYGNLLIDATAALNEKNLDFYELCLYMSNKYDIDNYLLYDAINKILDNGTKYLYSDTIKFLSKLKEEKNNVYLLTYSTQNSINFQKRKVDGSGLNDFFDEIYITSKPKYTLNIDYKNGIFIDDNPRELLGLYGTNPVEVIRIKRKFGKYSKRPLEIKVKEITNLTQLKL